MILISKGRRINRGKLGIFINSFRKGSKNYDIKILEDNFNKVVEMYNDFVNEIVEIEQGPKQWKSLYVPKGKWTKFNFFVNYYLTFYINNNDNNLIENTFELIKKISKREIVYACYWKPINNQNEYKLIVFFSKFKVKKNPKLKPIITSESDFNNKKGIEIITKNYWYDNYHDNNFGTELLEKIKEKWSE